MIIDQSYRNEHARPEKVIPGIGERAKQELMIITLGRSTCMSLLLPSDRDLSSVELAKLKTNSKSPLPPTFAQTDSSELYT